MSQSGSQNVKLSEEIISDIQRRSDAAGFESTDEYIEYILKVVLLELDPVEETQTSEDIHSRLESLGYLDS